MPSQFILGWAATAVFWVFAAAGASRAPALHVPKVAIEGGRQLAIRSFDCIAAAVVIMIVRVLTGGVMLH